MGFDQMCSVSASIRRASINILEFYTDISGQRPAIARLSLGSSSHRYLPVGRCKVYEYGGQVDESTRQNVTVLQLPRRHSASPRRPNGAGHDKLFRKHSLWLLPVRPPMTRGKSDVEPLSFPHPCCPFRMVAAPPGCSHGTGCPASPALLVRQSRGRTQV